MPICVEKTSSSLSPNYSRLLGMDIVRMPDKQKVTRDIFVCEQKTLSPDDKKKVFWKRIFTASTFTLVGLYLAHRNNLFNPVKLEAKKIILDKDFQKSVLHFVEGKISPDTYKKATKISLQNILADEKSTEKTIQFTKQILENENEFNKLFAKVSEKLADDETTLNEGYTVDLLDKLLVKIEKDLKKSKENGLPYKNQGKKIKDSMLNPPAVKGSSTAEELLIEVINNRSKKTIMDFINDLQSNV